MATTTLPLLLIPLIFYVAGTAAESGVAASSTSTDFIKASCKTTLYPAVCVQSLSGYASRIQQSRRQLAQTALSVSLARAQSTKPLVSKLSKSKGLKEIEYGALKDCLEEIGDSVEQLSNSVQELEQYSQAKGQEFMWHMSNVQTWVSAALTDVNTCVDGFQSQALDGRVKTAVEARVANVAQLTSTALAFINQFTQNH